MAPRVLSIQSHVVHGAVGNRAAVLPLQLLGLETDVLNTVQFSNTPDFGSFAGEKLEGEQLWELMRGLHENKLLRPTRLLTGYMGSASTVRALLRTLPWLSPDCQFWCDPVTTAHTHSSGQAAVRAHLARRCLETTDNCTYRLSWQTSTARKSSHTPMSSSQTSLRRSCSAVSTAAPLLVDCGRGMRARCEGVTIRSVDDARRACAVLHARGVHIVVITSCQLDCLTGDPPLTLFYSRRQRV